VFTSRTAHLISTELKWTRVQFSSDKMRSDEMRQCDVNVPKSKHSLQNRTAVMQCRATVQPAHYACK